MEPTVGLDGEESGGAHLNQGGGREGREGREKREGREGAVRLVVRRLLLRMA
jgi:hypothetical protein